MRRAEDLRFVTGRGCYVDDFTRPGLTHAVLVRSAHAHAQMSRIDATRALTRGGVLAVLTSADLPAMTAIPLRLAPLPGFDRYLQPPLAGPRVRYVGEPVAVVVAEDRHVAEDAAAAVAVENEVGTAVVDAHRALTDDVVIHEATGTNVASRYTVSRGDPDGAFAAADYTRVETFRCHRHTAVALETRGLVDAAAATSIPVTAADP
jgi:carbon-monoxide dehydrogenase large subunit